MESWNPYRWSLTFSGTILHWVDFCCWQKYRLKELGLIRQGETPHNIWYSMHCTLLGVFHQIFHQHIQHSVSSSYLWSSVQNFHRYDSDSSGLFSSVMIWFCCWESFANIYPSLNSDPVTLGKKFSVSLIIRSLFMWLFKGDSCVTSKLSQDFQNWMKIYTMLRIIFLDVQY